MSYQSKKVADVADALKKRFEELDNKADVLKATELKALYAEIPTLPEDERAVFGQEINALKNELQKMVDEHQEKSEKLPPIDVTAPFAPNTKPEDRPRLFTSDNGSRHPITAEMERIADIFYRMGYDVVESRQLDDDYHMFGSLNFPEDHPARDHYDTFTTEDGLIAPAHTSTMQNRVLIERKHLLEEGKAIAAVIPGRVFRNEDLDATHEHTFHQLEGVYVAKGANVGNLVATLQTYLSEYFGQDLKAKIQPFYFPFTEPSFEFAVERPEILRKDNSEEQRWLELGGCGTIHPNVLREAGIDPEVDTRILHASGIWH
ncbi:MAG: hypothetical protein U5L95_03320 [Candidatus Saccharibacteria bacterium]|nr:hypothetical protein [Candidatus Saccharibacteria bacterium]